MQIQLIHRGNLHVYSGNLLHVHVHVHVPLLPGWCLGEGQKARFVLQSQEAGRETDQSGKLKENPQFQAQTKPESLQHLETLGERGVHVRGTLNIMLTGQYTNTHTHSVNSYQGKTRPEMEAVKAVSYFPRKVKLP